MKRVRRKAATFKNQLIAMDACPSAVEFVGRKSLKSAWAKCERGDWMLWLAGRLNLDRKLLVLAACDCAETALQYVPKGENRPAEAIRIARLWCEGKAALREVRDASAAASAAAYAAAYAAYAAYAAAYAADAAADAAAYAADAADAAVADNADARKEHATLIRKHIPYAVIATAMQQRMKCDLKDVAHEGDPCKHCGTPHDCVNPGPCPAFSLQEEIA